MGGNKWSVHSFRRLLYGSPRGLTVKQTETTTGKDDHTASPMVTASSSDLFDEDSDDFIENSVEN